MDLDELRSFVESSEVDIWAVINGAIALASLDYPEEFKEKRDKIAAQLYSSRCHKCDANGTTTRVAASGTKTKPNQRRITVDESDDDDNNDDEGHHEREGSHDGRMQSSSPITFHDDEDDTFGKDDDCETELKEIEQLLADPRQTDEDVLGLLQRLSNMKMSVEDMMKTDIGKTVSAFRKHPSNEIRRIARDLIGSWKNLADQWVSTTNDGGNAAIADGESRPDRNGISRQNASQKYTGSYDSSSPLLRDNGLRNGALDNSKGKVTNQNVSSNPNGLRGANRNGELERTDAYLRKQGLKRNLADQSMANMSESERIASSKQRLKENYQQVENAKKQRTVQLLEQQECSKPKNTFNYSRGGGQNRHRFGGR